VLRVGEACASLSSSLQALLPLALLCAVLSAGFMHSVYHRPASSSSRVRWTCVYSIRKEYGVPCGGVFCMSAYSFVVLQLFSEEWISLCWASSACTHAPTARGQR
jgi:hypothetical protein